MRTRRNRFFTDKELKIIWKPSEWKLVCSGFPAEAPRVDDELHRGWLRDHLDAHVFREILFCLSGECVFSHQGILYDVHPGTLLLLNQFESHDDFYPARTSGTHLWLALVGGAVLVNLFTIRDGRIRRKISDRKQFPPMSHAVKFLYSAWDELDAAENLELPLEFKRQKIITAVSGVTLELVSAGYRNPETPTDSLRHQKQVMNLIKNLIVETGGNGVNTDQLARTAGYSKFHFQRLFKRHVGCTVHYFINQQRVKTTRDLLAKGLRKNEIADQLGFSSPAVFSRWFNQHFKT